MHNRKKRPLAPWWKVGLSIALALSFMLVFAQTTHAYNLEGPIWPNQPSPGTCCANLGVQVDSGMQSYDSQGWSNGMDSWNADPYADIIYSAVGSSGIQVADDSRSDVDWDGVTVAQKVWFFGWKFTVATSLLNYYYTQHDNPQQIQGIATHELGHVAGLDHSSGCVIMVPDTYTRWTTCRIDTPQADDNNGINAMY